MAKAIAFSWVSSKDRKLIVFKVVLFQICRGDYSLCWTWWNWFKHHCSFFSFSFHKNLHTYSLEIQDGWLVDLWFNATFKQYFNYIVAVSFIGVGNHGTSHQEKTTDLPQVTDNLYHIMLYRKHLAWVGFELTTWW